MGTDSGIDKGIDKGTNLDSNTVLENNMPGLLKKYPEGINYLPVFPHLDPICAALKESKSHFLVLTAETAAGKSTAVPLALLKNFTGNILMLEPRRLAVLNIAERVSSLLGEETGNTCGYIMHLEKKVKDTTRFTVLTEAILTRKIQSDPELTGVDVVVIDEFHERSVHADLALALLKESVQLRDNLYVIVMSATMETQRLSRYLGGDEEPAPVYKVPGRQFPVERLYAGEIPVEKAIKSVLMGTDSGKKGTDFVSQGEKGRETGVKPRVMGTDSRETGEKSHKMDAEAASMGTDSGASVAGNGSILVFLPGIAEIKKVQMNLEAMGTDAEILVLHSSVPFEQQKKVLSPSASGKKRIILSSAIAETSLTIPDVDVVIDSGLCRQNVFNQNAGMNQLVTKRESQFNADQRAGRAGRMKCGKCLCLWSENDLRPQENLPEIKRIDLSSLVLECYEWGVTSPEGLNWLDEPTAASWNTATELLELLGCVKDKRITELGKACLGLGVDLRLACTALSGIPYGKEEFSTGIAVKYSPAAKGTDYLYKKLEKDLNLRVQKAKKIHNLSSCFPQNSSEFSTGFALLCGFPDRLGVNIATTGNSGEGRNAGHKEQRKGIYQFRSGRVASLPENDQYGVLPEYIVAVNVDAGDATGRIYDYEVIQAPVAEKFLETRVQIGYKTQFIGDSSKIKKTKCHCYGKIVLKEVAVPVDSGDYIKALASRVAEKGLEVLPMSKKGTDLLNRARFYALYGDRCSLNGDRLSPNGYNSGSSGDSSSSNGDSSSFKYKLETLHLTLEEWLAPFVSPDCTSVNETQVYDALYWYLEGKTINEKVPYELVLPNGKKRRITYEEKGPDMVPVLEIIIQQVFGCFETPQICGQPVVFKLLSPARRPLQITSDLENFWKETWPQICSEMKGRYPKHNWDYRVVEKGE